MYRVSRFAGDMPINWFPRLVVGIIVIILLIAVFNPIMVNTENGETIEKTTDSNVINNKSPESSSRGASRGARTLSFTENSTGLPTSGDYNFVAFGDINNDGNIDIAYGGENYGSANTVGVYVNTSTSSTTWSPASTGLWTGNAWGGLDMVDADSDGAIEFYATNERWGSGNSSGLKVWEYRSNKWTDSGTHVSSPLSSGRPDNVVVANITGDSKLDIVVSNSSNSGLAYFENTGGNPATWKAKSNGLATSREFTAIAVGDVNKDGLKDIVALDYSGGEHLYVQQTSGALWSEYSTGLAASGTNLGVAIGDVNMDSHMDIIYGGHGGGLKCYLGNSGGGSGGTSFSWSTANTGLPTGGRYYQIQVVDIDLDGDLDIIAPEAGSNSVGIRIYLGNGSTSPGMNLGWTLATGTGLISSGYWYGSNCYDINKDGSLDIVAASWGSGIKCYLNTATGNFDLTPPGTVADLTVTNRTVDSLTVNWTAPADNGSIIASGPVQNYDIRYSTSDITLGNWASATLCTGEPTPATPGTSQGFKITGLNEATLYYIALRSQDEYPNLSQLSNIVFNTTLGIIDTIRPGKIADLKAENPTNNSINLTWSAPADNGTDSLSGSVIEYKIKYYSSLITNASWLLANNCSTPPTPNLPGSNEKYQVTGLEENTTYYFAVKARDERPNWGWISNSPFNTTLLDPDLIPPGVINDLSALNPTDTTINLTWTSVGDDGALGNASSYDIRYSTSTITDITWSSASICNNVPKPKNPGITENYQVTGLNPDTTYYFAIKTSDETPLWSPLSNIAFAKTLISQDEITPGKILDLATSEPTDSSIKLTWSAPGDDGNIGMVSGYEIRYNASPITDLIWEISKLCPNHPTPKSPGEQQEYTVVGLLSSTKYYFAVKAYDERPNFAPLSNIANGTTLASEDTTPPNTITDLEASTLSSNSIKLTWTAPGDDDDSGTATGYDIRFATQEINDTSWSIASLIENEPTPQQAGETENFIVTGIFSGTKYYFAVKAFDERPNLSGLSNIASATTYWSEDNTGPAKITDLSVMETTKNSATLTWTAPGDDGDSGVATSYDIRHYSTSITDDIIWGKATVILETPTPKTAGENETFLVTGLDEDTTYFFAIKTADEKPNWSPISNSPFGRTLGSAKPELGINLVADKTELTSKDSFDIVISVFSKLTNLAVDGATVLVTSDHVDLIIDPTSSVTDNNGDLTINITTPEVFESTKIIISVEVEKINFKSNLSSLEITVIPDIQPPVKKFNLRIRESDISISNATIREDDKITIYANISNIGERDSTAFSVRFSINDQSIGNTKQYSSILMDGSQIVEMAWTAILGNHTLKVEIITIDTNLESTSVDNSVEKLLTVLAKESVIDVDKDKDEVQTTDDKEFSIMDYLVYIILIIIVIVVILILIFTRKRKSDPDELEDTTLEPASTPEIDYGETDSVQEVQENEQISEVLEADQQYFGAQVPDTVYPDDAVASGEVVVGGETHTYTSSDGEFEYNETEAEAEADMQSEDEDQFDFEENYKALHPPAEQIDLDADLDLDSDIDSDLAITQTVKSEPAIDNGQESVDQQNVACPICQGEIPVYSNPCPNCNSELNWE